MTARVLAGACLLALASASPALAATTIGQTGGNMPCVGGYVAFDTSYIVPAGGGTITSFSYGDDGHNAGAQLDFEVLRPNADGTYTIIGDTGLKTLTGAVGDETFPAHISAASGDLIGYYESGTDNCLTVGTLDNVGAIFVGSDPAAGETLDGSTASTLTNFSLNESATLGSASSTLTATGATVSGSEGAQLSGSLATFADADDQPVSDYSATIDWGDGSTSSGVVSQTGPGQYAISGSHTYIESGSYAVGVDISDQDGDGAQAQGAATIADATVTASGVGSAANPAATPANFSGPVVSLSDQNLSGSPGDFTATIDWGDGTSSHGSVAGSGGSYTVSGSHAYAADGPYTVRVHVTDDGGSTADAASYLVVYENASSGGSFVIGDQAAGPEVYFSGPRWAAENPISGGSAPASFKGFANGSAQSCGHTFTATPGNSPAHPSRVPAYTAVAVTDGVTKSGAEISGDVVRVVVVRTNPAAPGMGQVVATICG